MVIAQGADPTVSLAGHPASEPALRDGLESAYRDLATHAPSSQERVRLVDRANTVRRWTLR
jgi:serine/threonine-protein kinase PknG